MATPPFIDPESTTLKTGQIYREALPIAKLLLAFAGAALVPFLLVVLIGGNSSLAVPLTLASQFVLAVGAGVVLMYVVARGVQLARPDRVTESAAGTVGER